MKKLFFFIIFAMMTGSTLFAQEVFQTNTYVLSTSELNNLTASFAVLGCYHPAPIHEAFTFFQVATG